MAEHPLRRKSDDCGDCPEPAERAELAKTLDDWKGFSIAKFDQIESTIASIKENQDKYIDIVKASKHDIAELKRSLKNNTDISQETKDGVAELLALWNGAKAAGKTINWGRKGLVWASSVAGALAVLKTAWHGSLKWLWAWWG